MVDYADGMLLSYWYESWLVIPGFIVGFILALWVLALPGWRGGAMVVKALMVLAVLAALPLTMARLGITVAISDDEAIGYFSMIGVAASLALGVFYLNLLHRIEKADYRNRPGFQQPEPPQRALTDLIYLLQRFERYSFPLMSFDE